MGTFSNMTSLKHALLFLAQANKERAALIDSTLNPLLADYLSGKYLLIPSNPRMTESTRSIAYGDLKASKGRCSSISS